jgi:hypothetical protein
MGGKMSRDKGGRGEREVIALMQPIVDRVCDANGHARFEIRRNYTQRFAAKEYDLIGVPWMALEVKRVEEQSGLEGWWRQVIAATRDGQVSVLLYRQNNRPWKARFRTLLDTGGERHVRATVTVDIETFLVWFEVTLDNYLKR